jgi:hypothetical protein
LHGVRIVQLGGLELVPGALEVTLRDDMNAPGFLGALELAFGRSDLHLGQVAVLAALENLAAYFDGLAIEVRFHAGQRGALALVFIGEGGAFDHAQDIAGVDRVARTGLVDDNSRRFREQRGADRGDDRPGGGHVAHEGPALHHRGAQPVTRDGLLRGQPGAHAPHDGQQQQQCRHTDEGVAPQQQPGVARFGNLAILGLSAAHRHIAQKHGHTMAKARRVPTTGGRPRAVLSN